LQRPGSCRSSLTRCNWIRKLQQSQPTTPGRYLYWRVEGSLLELTTVRPVAFFTWNAQKFTERWLRRGTVLLMAMLRPFLYVLNRTFATRVVYSILRGISRDRFDGHGSAIAQVYNHMILPLANARDKRTQVRWGVRDFETRFGRKKVVAIGVECGVLDSVADGEKLAFRFVQEVEPHRREHR